MKVVVPILISQKVKINYDQVLTASGILKGSGSQSSLLIRVCPQLFLARPCLLYISTVQWQRPDVLPETGLPICSQCLVWQSASEWKWEGSLSTYGTVLLRPSLYLRKSEEA